MSRPASIPPPRRPGTVSRALARDRLGIIAVLLFVSSSVAPLFAAGYLRPRSARRRRRRPGRAAVLLLPPGRPVRGPRPGAAWPCTVMQQHGALYDPIPGGWVGLAAVTVPVLGVHGGDDPVSPLASGLTGYATARSAELVSISGGRHDALNDQDHRTVAATVVLFLERLRRAASSGPIAIREELAQP